MSSQNNEKLLELYTKAISIEALQNAEKYLENSLPLGKGVAKERLIEKALYEEQQIEHNRKLAESLRTEFKDLEHSEKSQFLGGNSEISFCFSEIVCDANKLRTVEELRQERDELIKRRAAEDAVLPEVFFIFQKIFLNIYFSEVPYIGGNGENDGRNCRIEKKGGHFDEGGRGEGGELHLLEHDPPRHPNH